METLPDRLIQKPWEIERFHVLPDLMILVMYSETNTDPKEWFVGERGELIMGLWSLIIFHQKKKRIYG